MTYTVPDYRLDDIEADNRDARDLERESMRAQAWDDLLSDDGDISPIVDMLNEHLEDVAALLVAYHKGESLDDASAQLAARLHSLAGDHVEDLINDD